MNKDLTSITAYLEDLKETVERNRDKILDLTINQKKSDEELTQGRDKLEKKFSVNAYSLLNVTIILALYIDVRSLIAFINQ